MIGLKLTKFPSLISIFLRVKSFGVIYGSLFRQGISGSYPKMRFLNVEKFMSDVKFTGAQGGI